MAEVIPVVSEADLQGAVTGLCTWLGITWWHDADSRKNKAGLPDLILIGRRRDAAPPAVLWRELKSAKGKFRPGQKEFGGALILAGANWAIWRPDDWRSGRIRTELENIR